MKKLLENQSWATNFRTLRGAMTQEQAAAALCGAPVATIRDWEQGRRTPPEWVQYLIAGELMRKSIAKKPTKGAR